MSTMRLTALIKSPAEKPNAGAAIAVERTWKFNLGGLGLRLGLSSHMYRTSPGGRAWRLCNPKEGEVMQDLHNCGRVHAMSARTLAGLFSCYTGTILSGQAFQPHDPARQYILKRGTQIFWSGCHIRLASIKLNYPDGLIPTITTATPSCS